MCQASCTHFGEDAYGPCPCGIYHLEGKTDVNQTVTQMNVRDRAAHSSCPRSVLLGWRPSLQTDNPKAAMDKLSFPLGLLRVCHLRLRSPLSLEWPSLQDSVPIDLPGLPPSHSSPHFLSEATRASVCSLVSRLMHLHIACLVSFPLSCRSWYQCHFLQEVLPGV